MLGFSPLASAPIGAVAAAGANAYLLATEAPDAASASVSITASASLAASESQDTASASLSLTASLSLSATEPGDTASGSADAVTLANLLAVEAQDSASGSAQVNPATAALAATEAADTAAISTAIVASASLAAAGAQDTAAGSASAVTNAALAATEAADVAAFSSVILNDVRLAAVEAPDTASLTTGIVATAALSASEASDSAAGGMVVQWAVIPAGPSVWAPQADGVAFWQSISNALTPANMAQTGGPLASAPIGGAPIAAVAATPSGGAIGALWTQPAAGVVYWDQINPPQPQANNRPTGCLGGAPIGGVATAEGLSDAPTATPGSAVWTPVQSTFTPTQEAA